MIKHDDLQKRDWLIVCRCPFCGRVIAADQHSVIHAKPTCPMYNDLDPVSFLHTAAEHFLEWGRGLESCGIVGQTVKNQSEPGRQN